jgi:hypothetical protein
LPWDEIRDWFHKEGNYVDVIDRAAEAISTDMNIASSRVVEERLLKNHEVDVSRDMALPDETLRRSDAPTLRRSDAPTLRRFDASRGLLAIHRSPPIESHFQLHIN